MIVQCPSCSARYRVNEQNIPATGGRISCPSCQHTFIVYPESNAPAPVAKPASYDGEKTSVATDINALVAGFGGQGGFTGGGGGGDDLATEVISGDALANFNFQSPAPEPPQEDGTVEMQNPMAFIKQNKDLFGDLGDMMTESTIDDSSLKTEVASGLDFDHMMPSTPPATPSAPQVPSFGRGPAFATGPRPAVPAATPASQAPPQPLEPQPPASPPSTPQLPPSQPAAAPAPAGPDASHTGPWKLKTDFGLTYEFQDTRSLTNWMSGRESLDNYELSVGDDHFHAWASFPQISAQLASAGGLGAQSSAAFQTGRQQSVAPSFPVNTSPSPSGGFPAASGAPSTPGTPMFGVPGVPERAPIPSPDFPPRTGSSPAAGRQDTLGKPVVSDQNFSPPSRDAKWNALLWVLFIVLAVGCLALAAQIFGVVDFKEMLGIQSNTGDVITQPDPIANKPSDSSTPLDEVVTDPAQAPDAGSPEERGPSEEDRAMATTMIEEARAEMDANHLSTAREKLESALVLDPKRAQIYMLLAQVYEQLGQSDKAKEMRDTMQSLNVDDMKMEGEDPIMP